MAQDRRGRVLLVEDEPNIAEAIRFILGRDGWQVQHVADGRIALEQIRAAPPQALILDLMVPGLSGLELLALLRADPDLASLPVLMLTARGQARDREAATLAGATQFIAKPFSNAELLDTMRSLVPAQVAP